MRSSFVAVAASAVLVSAASASVVTQWNYNGSGAGSASASTGTGTTSGVGGVSTAINVAGSPSDPVIPAGDNFAFTSSTYAAQGTGSGTRGVQFASATSGFENIMVSFQQRNSNTASRFWQFQYSLDGSTFTSASLTDGGVYSLTAGSTWFTYSFDLSAIAGVANNANFAVRTVAIFDVSGAYATTSGTGNYGTTGTARFDLVTIEGTAVPAPGALALLSVAGLLGARRRRA